MIDSISEFRLYLLVESTLLSWSCRIDRMRDEINARTILSLRKWLNDNTLPFSLLFLEGPISSSREAISRRVRDCELD